MKQEIYINTTPTKEDEEMTKLFQEAVKWEIKKNKVKGLPIAKYDGRKKKGYLQYPDGSKEYGF